MPKAEKTESFFDSLLDDLGEAVNDTAEIAASAWESVSAFVSDKADEISGYMNDTSEEENDTKSDPESPVDQPDSPPAKEEIETDLMTDIQEGLDVASAWVSKTLGVESSEEEQDIKQAR
jgi:hypothetical protein